MQTAVFWLTLCSLVAPGADAPPRTSWSFLCLGAYREPRPGGGQYRTRRRYCPYGRGTPLEERRPSGDFPEEAKKIAVKDNTFLYVNVAVASGGWAATVLAQFAQAAYLLRNSLPIGTAFTWTDVSTLLSPSLDSVRSEIKDLVDKFLNEWLKQNPRRLV